MRELGVLALQGNFAAHLAVLRGLGARVREVKRCSELAGLAGLILPGGESSTMLRLMAEEPWFEAIREFSAQKKAIFGTCAGAILLAREVNQPSQPSLGLLDVSLARNAYGSQAASFEDEVVTLGQSQSLRGVFIRAPRFVALGAGVEVLGTLRGAPVLVREGHLLASTFHPELTHNASLHQYFLSLTTTR